MKKISFITTVKNDSSGLKVLLDSLKQQTKQPDEIVIIDGEKTKTNRSQARNLAIQKAKGRIIAVSDAGCRLDKNWLEEITNPFSNPKIDVAAGYYKPVAKTVFQKCLACYTCVFLDKVRPCQFLPSSRSIAFRKKAWKKVGGYPASLNYCEDLVFAQKLKKADCKFKFIKKAVVFWPQKENIFQAFWQFFHYASGDAQAFYWPHLKKIGLVYLRYLLAFFLCYYSLCAILYTLFSIYCFWAVWKNYRYVKHPSAIFYLPLLQVAADLAVMSGALRGLAKRL